MNEFNAVSTEELSKVEGGWSIGGLIAGAVTAVLAPVIAAPVTIVLATEGTAS
jgi:hypothetical protein